MRVIIFVLFLGILGCQKDPGKGGTGEINGRIFAYDVNSDGIRQDSGYIMDQKVYISYGDGNYIDDETRTSSDGSFRFQGLQKGNYTIRVFGYCPSCPLSLFEDAEKVSLTKSGKNITLRDLKTQFK